MLYAAELVPRKYCAVKGYPAGDEPPEPAIDDLPCALYRCGERLTDFCYTFIYKIDGGFQGTRLDESGTRYCRDVLDGDGNVLRTDYDIQFPYDSPYNNYLKGYDTTVQRGTNGYYLTNAAGHPIPALVKIGGTMYTLGIESVK